MDGLDEIGGSRYYLALGSRLTKIGNWLINLGKKYTDKGTKTIISNPTCRLINPFTLMVNFTVNGTQKYQLVLQGDYKNKYREVQDTENPIEPKEMFLLIRGGVKAWYLKE